MGRVLRSRVAPAIVTAMRARPSFQLAAVSLVVLLSSPAARAQSDADRATARALGVDAERALEAKDYKTAEDRFRRADRLVHAPTLMLGLARSLAGEGKYVEAQETYNRILRDGVAPGSPDAFKRALNDAKKEVDGVAAKVGSVTITVKSADGAAPGDLKVVLDDEPIDTASLGVHRAIDPGAHVLRVSAPGYVAAETKFDVPAGGSTDVPVTLAKEPNAATAVGAAVPASPAPAAGAAAGVGTGGGGEGSSDGVRKALPWVAFGVGGAGLVVGAVAGLVAIGKHSDIQNACGGNDCTASHGGDVDSYHTVAAVSTVGFVVAGLGAAGGVVLLLTQPKSEGAAPPATGIRVVPTIGLGSLGAVGTF